MNEEVKTAAEYDAWMAKNTLAGRWMRFWMSPHSVMFVNTQVYKLKQRLDLKPSDKVLDIGCGCGSLLIYLTKQVDFSHVIEGVDGSKAMVKLAEKEIEKRSLTDRITIKVSNASQLPYPDESFDVVISANVIKHLSDETLRTMMMEVKRVLRKNGRFCCWDMGPSKIKWLTQSYERMISVEVSTTNLRSTEDIQAIAREAGFNRTNEFARGIYLLYPFIPRAGLIAINQDKDSL